ncbi:hypothetical protein PLESTB_001167300 [Pleodorina starrii]|uniref:Protein kinase domain-containing protein n=1 Tax=Pleodorina starrii TaxID=330485 RepID=A0A9W6F5F9_9CHLO|nr:hypothetical protein PLESTM_000243100 [Pleodorina starrii]GLC56954.1 hypothetical protein PLESTB_001167300 [Pleodorina starrii]
MLRRDDPLRKGTMTILGRGGLATVVRISDQYALKVLSDLRTAEEEAAIYQLLGGGSPTIVAFYGIFGGHETGSQHAALLLELCDGSLSDLLFSAGGQRLRSASELLTQQYIVMMLNCVAQLHGRGVIHQDIKPSNFLFGRDGSIKLADFNLSRIPSDETRANGGTLLYFSPQKFNSTDDGYAADWWGFGVTLYQVLHGLQTWPFSNRSLHQISKLPADRQLALVRKAVLKGKLRFRSLSGIPRAARTLIRGLLHPRPEHRWGLVHVLAGDYPADQAFSAVALRFPHLAPDMERLLAVRRFCRSSPFHWQPVASTFEEQGGTDASEPRDAKTSARANATFHSLRALSSCLLTRKRSYKCSSPMAAAAPAPRPPAVMAAAEINDLVSSDQLGFGACRAGAAVLKREPPPAAQQEPALCGASPGPAVGSRTTSAADAPPGPTTPAMNTRLPEHHAASGSSASPEVNWTSRTSRCLPGAFSGGGGGSGKTSWRKALLLPRTDTSVRAAAARVLSPSSPAAAPPASLVTPDGRLAPSAFVPCEVRTHTLDLGAVCQALAAAMGTWSGGGADSEQPRELAAKAAGRAATQAGAADQVQRVEVLEEMRLMLERRRLAAVAAAGAGAAGANRLVGDVQPTCASSRGEGPTSAWSASPAAFGEDAVTQTQARASTVAQAQARAPEVAPADIASPNSPGAGASRQSRVCGSSGEVKVEAMVVQPGPGPGCSSSAAAVVDCAAPLSPFASPVALTAEEGSGSGRTAGEWCRRAGAETATTCVGAPPTASVLPEHLHPGALPTITTPGEERGLLLATAAAAAGGGGRGGADGDGGVPAGRCNGLAVVAAEPHGPLAFHTVQGSRGEATEDRPSWSGGRLEACAAAAAAFGGSPTDQLGGTDLTRRGALHAGGSCSASLLCSGGGDGGGVPECSSSITNSSTRKVPDRGGSGGGSDSAAHADDAGSLFSLPFSSGGGGPLESGAVEAEAVAAMDPGTAALVLSPQTSSAVEPRHLLAPAQRLLGSAAPPTRAGLSAGGSRAAEGCPEHGRSLGALAVCTAPLGDGLAAPLEDERPTWGSEAAGGGGSGGGCGSGGGGSSGGDDYSSGSDAAAARSGGWRGLRGQRRGAASPCAAAGPQDRRGSRLGLTSPTSTASTSGSPLGSPASACSAAGSRAGCAAACGGSGGGAARSPSAPMPEAGGRYGGRGRALTQRGRDASSAAAAHSSAWGAGSNRVPVMRNGTLARTVKQGVA